jgi:hypothetical protein
VTSLQHQRYDGSEAEAVAFLRQGGPWARSLTTPWPGRHLVGGAVFAVGGVWGAIVVGEHSILGGLGVLLLALAVGALEAAPGIYTLTHREYAAQFLAARRTHGDGQYRRHPYLVLVGFPVLFGLVAAFGGHTHTQESTDTRLVWAAVGAVAGLALAIVRLGAARRQPQR